MTNDPLKPPNSAAFLSPTGVSVNLDNGGGGCPVMFGEEKQEVQEVMTSSLTTTGIIPLNGTTYMYNIHL